MKKPHGFMALFAVILVAAMVLAVFGGRMFSAVTQGREENNSRRACLSYLQTKVQAYDTPDGVSVESGAYGTELVLREDAAGYVTRIYLYDGMIREQLCAETEAADPGEANAIFSASSFFVDIQGGLVSFRADGLQGCVSLQCAGGQEHG